MGVGSAITENDGLSLGRYARLRLHTVRRPPVAPIDWTENCTLSVYAGWITYNVTDEVLKYRWRLRGHVKDGEKAPASPFGIFESIAIRTQSMAKRGNFQEARFRRSSLPTQARATPDILSHVVPYSRRIIQYAAFLALSVNYFRHALIL